MAKVMISVPDGFLHEIDRVARRRHQTRSEFLREAARHYIWRAHDMENSRARSRRSQRVLDDSQR